jgi:hypothetical protein
MLTGCGVRSDRTGVLLGMLQDNPADRAILGRVHGAGCAALCWQTGKMPRDGLRDLQHRFA